MWLGQQWICWRIFFRKRQREIQKVHLLVIILLITTPEISFLCPLRLVLSKGPSWVWWWKYIQFMKRCVWKPTARTVFTLGVMFIELHCYQKHLDLKHFIALNYVFKNICMCHFHRILFPCTSMVPKRISTKTTSLSLTTLRSLLKII